MIVSHAISAARLAQEGIGPAIGRAVITMNAQILGAIRYEAKGDTLLARVLADEHVTITGATDEGFYIAALLVDAVELAAIRCHLIALREEAVNIGYTPARIRRGFSRYAVDVAMESTTIAQYELELMEEGERAA